MKEIKKTKSEIRSFKEVLKIDLSFLMCSGFQFRCAKHFSDQNRGLLNAIKQVNDGVMGFLWRETQSKCCQTIMNGNI